MKKVLVCFVLVLSFVCMPIGSQTSYGATKTKAQSKYVSNKVLKKWKKRMAFPCRKKVLLCEKRQVGKGLEEDRKKQVLF